MPTKNKTKRTAAPRAGNPLTLKVTIPAGIAPLFRAMAEIHMVMCGVPRKGHETSREASYEDVASHAVIRWLVSEEAQEKMDACISEILRAEQPLS